MVAATALEMQMDGLRSEVQEQQRLYNEALSQFKAELQTSGFEVQSKVMEQVREMATGHASASDMQRFKAEVYKYIQGNVQQITSAYGPKFKTLYDFMDQVGDSLKTIGDFRSHENLAFEEFKNNVSL